MKTITANAPEGALNPSVSEKQPVVTPPSNPHLSLESVCEYACRLDNDADANIISHMLMAQYMQQGLCIPELANRILGIPDTRKQLKREEQYKALHPQGTLNTDQLPPTLRTPAARDIWQTLYAEGLVDEDCQTLCSRTESGLMAAAIAKVLGIRNVWVTFEELWGMSNLKSARDKAFDYQNGWNFQKRLDNLIH